MDRTFPHVTDAASVVRRTGPLDLEARLIRRTEGQLGVFTTKQAGDLGLTHDALYQRKRAGVIVPMFPGVYRIAAVEESREQLTLAACLSVPNAVVGGVSAALLQGLPAGVAYNGRPTLIIPHDMRAPGRSGIEVRRTRHPYRTHPWRTARITQVSSTLITLAGSLSRDQLARCLDHAIAHRLVSMERLLKEAESRPTSRFVGRADLLAEVHARIDQPIIHRSSYEQLVNRWIRESSLPRPRTNFKVPIIGRNTFVEVDFGWPEDCVALEVSPFFTHGSAATQRRDMQRRVWLQEMRWRIVEATDEHLIDRQSFAPVIESLERLLGVGAFS